jgi:hypothetical protein
LHECCCGLLAEFGLAHRAAIFQSRPFNLLEMETCAAVYVLGAPPAHAIALGEALPIHPAAHDVPSVMGAEVAAAVFGAILDGTAALEKGFQRAKAVRDSSTVNLAAAPIEQTRSAKVPPR